MKKKIKFIFIVFILAIGIVIGVYAERYLGQDSGKNSVTAPIELSSEKDGELILALQNYLSDFTRDYDFVNATIAEKISKIKNGKLPLYMEFDSSRSYFVAAYYDDPLPGESGTFDHLKDYCFVKYENAEDILETYRNASIIVAVQVNPAVAVRDIRSTENPMPTVERFCRFNPSFKNGYNTEKALSSDSPMIALVTAGEDTVYLSDHWTRRNTTIGYLSMNGQEYLTESTFGYPDLHYHFGSYYDTLCEIMLPNEYLVVNKDGGAASYWLFPLEEFVNTILK